jgi:adenylosuccinate synthase
MDHPVAPTFPDAAVVLSGHVAVGKTTLARGLGVLGADREYLGTREILLSAADHGSDRRALQQLGEQLDRTTGGAWVRNAIVGSQRASCVIIDAVRTAKQVELIRGVVPTTLHVHLVAPLEILKSRYEFRRLQRPNEELDSYEAVLANPTEAHVGFLRELADVVLDTARLSASDCVAAADAALVAGRP